MLESEAKTKWCPMVRTGLTAGMAVNHHVGSSFDAPIHGDVHEETRCIARACMMWRETAKAPITTKPHGYCGIAGKETP